MIGVFWTEMGFIRYPLAIAAVALALQTALAIWRLRGPGEADPAGLGRDTILVWGLLAATVGGIGTLIGIAQMSRALAQASAVSPTLIWGGLRVTMTSTVAGLILLAISAMAWLAIDYVRARRTPTAG